MVTNRYKGIQTNALVLPSRIGFSSKKGEATYQEKGFSFAIPREKQEKLKEIFLKGSKDSEVNQRKGK